MATFTLAPLEMFMVAFSHHVGGGVNFSNNKKLNFIYIYYFLKFEGFFYFGFVVLKMFNLFLAL